MSTLDLSIDRGSDLPLATQLAWKLRTLIATGQLAPGARLPGVREVAAAADVNVNTVRAVYRRLEQETLIRSEHGRGTFVAERARAQRGLADIVAQAAVRAHRAGLDLRDVAAAMFVDPGLPPDPVGRQPAGAVPVSQTSAGQLPDERVHRRQLRAEIAQLERELGYVEGVTGEPLPRGGAEPGRILETAELESIRDGLGERLAQRREDVEALRRRLLADRQEAAERATRAPVGRRAWAHTGVSTGRLAPGVAGVVWTSGS
jgi:DNA-binding transcriptional regulator YhcF (GntR family)